MTGRKWFTVVYTTNGEIPLVDVVDALNTIHRRRDLLASVYLGAVAVIVRLQLTGTQVNVLSRK